MVSYEDHYVFSVDLVCKEELNLVLKLMGLLVKVQLVWAKRQYLTGLRYAEIEQVNKIKRGKQHDNERMRGERVKIPFLQNKVGKRSGTMVTTQYEETMKLK